MKGMRLDDIMGELKDAEKKQWFAWAIAGVVMADDKMSKPEEKYMRELFLNHCTPELSSAIADAMKKNTKITLDILKLEDRGLAAKILKYLVIIAAIDKDIPQAEKEFLQLIGNKLGFEARVVNHTIAWRKRELARQAESTKDENEITLQLRSERPQYGQ